jgi:membrane protein DedA with SNARE-associated domain
MTEPALFQYLVTHYGYAAVLVGTFAEGETVLVLGGLAAHRGYLELPWVLVCAFAGTLIGDQLFFHIGRLKGARVLEKRPHWRQRAQRAFELLQRHQTLMAVGFRFMYGLRTVTPFLLGASGVSSVRFLALNAIGAAAWSVVVGGLGYLLGRTVELLLGDVKRYELWLFAGAAAVGVAIWCVNAYLNSRRSRKRGP